MKHPIRLSSSRSARSYEGFSHSWQIATVTGNLGLWKVHHHEATLGERFGGVLEKAKRRFLLAFSPETLVREQMVAANARRLRVRPGLLPA